MSMSDPISDMLTRIRNAGNAQLPTVDMPASKLKAAVAEVLKDEGYIEDWELLHAGTVDKTLRVALKYMGKNAKPVIEGLRRVSKPSCRTYVGSQEIPRVLGGLGVAILSTSQGILAGETARRRNVGGEVLCYVW